jgi:hypothetical protein
MFVRRDYNYVETGCKEPWECFKSLDRKVAEHEGSLEEILHELADADVIIDAKNACATSDHLDELLPDQYD